MNSDIITSAPRPEDLPSIARASHDRTGGEAPSAAPSAAPAARSARVGGRAGARRPALEALGRAVIRSIGAARPVRALEAFVDRWLAADLARQQAAEAAAAAHVLRVYRQLAEGEQRMVSELLREGTLGDLLASIVHRGEDESLEIVRRRIGTLDPIVSAATLARQIGAIRGHLTSEEYDRVILRLPHLSAEEQQLLHAHLCAMTPADAAMVLRSYLRPIRS
ncbi:MAG TPA: hypothetical protein VNO30_16095 [Kofleriaceae bacterium]|nr:hypothetical protein [Kofleriaceae bacterium]